MLLVRSTSRIGLLSVLIGLGCGGAASTSAKARAPLPSNEPKPAPAQAEAPLEPVAEPSALLAVARLEPGALERLRPDSVAAGFVPFSDLWPFSGLARELADPAGALEVALSLDSVEALLGRGPEVAISFPVSSRAAAMDRLSELESAGAVGLDRQPDGTLVVSFLERAGDGRCALARSVGPSPLRLVCGDRRSLAALGPYLARGLPVRDLGGAGSLVLEAWPARLEKHAGALRGIARFASGRVSPGVARATDVLLGDALELAADTERVRVRVEVHRAGGARVSASLELRRKGSWAARTLTTLRPSAAARSMFEKLPADSELAWYFSGADPARAREARASLVQWLKAHVGPSYPSDTLDLVARTFVPESPVVYAQGDATGFDAKSYYGGYALWERTLSTFGWHVIGYAEPAAGLAPKLDAGMKAYNSGDLSRLAYSELPRLCPGLGKIKKRTPPRELPKGSALYELEMPGQFFEDCAKRFPRWGWGSSPARARRAPSLAMVVVMVPDGERTFIGFGPDREAMIQRMRSLSRPSPSETLGSLLPLGALAEPPDQAAGFTSLRGVGGLLRFATMAEHWTWRRSNLGALPDQGKAPVAFGLRVKDGSPARIELELHVPDAVIRDLERL